MLVTFPAFVETWDIVSWDPLCSPAFKRKPDSFERAVWLGWSLLMHTSLRHRPDSLRAVNLSSSHTRIPPRNSGGCACLAAGVSEYPGEPAVSDPDQTSIITVWEHWNLHFVFLSVSFSWSISSPPFSNLQPSQTLATLSWIGMGGCRAAPCQKRYPLNSVLGRGCTGQGCFVFSSWGQGGMQGWQEQPEAPSQVKVVGPETTEAFSLHPKSSVVHVNILPLPAHHSTLPETLQSLQREIFLLRFLKRLNGFLFILI